MRGKAQTVQGLVDPAVLGSTLMHEHLIWDLRPPPLRQGHQGEEPGLANHWGMTTSVAGSPANLHQPSVEVAIEAVAEAVAHGCQTIVELTIGGIGPNPNGLKQVSDATGCHIVMGCGHYVEEYQPPENHHRSIDDFAAEMVSQVQEGLWGTEVRAGLLGEIGCQSPWHIDRTVFDEDALFRLADTGVVLEWDLFGQESCLYPLNPDVDMPNDAGRLRAMRKILDRGHKGQIVIAHDICHRSHMTRWGGWGYAHIHRIIIPLMRRRGFSEAEIKEILVDTPRRLLTFI